MLEMVDERKFRDSTLNHSIFVEHVNKDLSNATFHERVQKLLHSSCLIDTRTVLTLISSE